MKFPQSGNLVNGLCDINCVRFFKKEDCMINLMDPKMGKRHKIFQDLVDSGRAIEMTRKPLSESAIANIVEKMARNKEDLRRGEYFKKNSLQRFGEE